MNAYTRGGDLNTILTIPGLGGSGTAHWQSFWDTTHSQCRRVHQDNWNIPDFDAWITGLHLAISSCSEPPFLVAHSLGCALVAHWARKHPDIEIGGALLVAPADVESEHHTPPEAHIFAPMPMAVLPFPSILVASSTDPYLDLRQAQVFATAWGAEFVNIGPYGHINVASHMDEWDEGWALLQSLKKASCSLSRA